MQSRLLRDFSTIKMRSIGLLYECQSSIAEEASPKMRRAVDTMLEAMRERQDD
jgi:hypothetical protein